MTYCISDIHGCYHEFMELLEKIKFCQDDTLYVLGDVTDRGPYTMECFEYIYSQPNITMLMGNHEDLMLKYFPGAGRKRNKHWLTQGGDKPLKQINKAKRNPATKARWDEIFAWIKGLPLYADIEVGGKKFLLAHAGINVDKEGWTDLASLLALQEPRDLIWIRHDFFLKPALATHHCIFGHSPTYYIRENNDCSIWVDPVHKDKTCIDSACVYGGALAALRLDDGEVFYVKSRQSVDRLLTIY